MGKRKNEDKDCARARPQTNRDDRGEPVLPSAGTGQVPRLRTVRMVARGVIVADVIVMMNVMVIVMPVLFVRVRRGLVQRGLDCNLA